MLNSARPVAYIRRSNQTKQESKDAQTAAVRDLARANGDADRLVLLEADWGKSGATDKTEQRLDFLRLLDMVEKGEASAVYAIDIDRLARSIEYAARLWNFCRRAQVPIITSAGRLEPWVTE